MIDQVSKMNEIQLNEWEQKLGFKSLQTEYKEISEQLTKAEDAKDLNLYRQILNANKDLLILLADGSFSQKYNKSLYLSFTNRSSVYKVGNSFIKYENDKILEAEGNTLKNIDFKVATKHSILNLDNDRANCGAFQHVERINGDRRANLDITLYYCYGCCGMVRGAVSFRAWGEKKNLFGNWKDYTTSINIKNGGYGLFNSFGTYVTADNISANSNSDVYSLTTISWVDPTFTGNPISLTFDKVKGKATTRGTDDWHWAMDCCGYTSGCPDPNNP